MSSRSKICAALALASSAAAMLAAPAASAFDYSYVEGGYVDIDGAGADDSGFRLAGSLGIAPHVALLGEYADVGDLSQISAGAIFHDAINTSIDWFVGGTFERIDINAGPNDFDDTGFGLRGGLRWKVASAVELVPEIRYLDIFDDTLTSVRLGGLFNVASQLQLQAAIQGGDDDRIELGVRYNF